MANFTAADVKALRERTSCGMMDCKKALTEANGDMESAVELLRKKGLAASEKKAGRIAAEGAVIALVENGVGAVVEVNAETDFVAKNDKFMAFVNDVAKTVIAANPADLDALLATALVGKTTTVEEELRELILVIGENMKVRRFERYEGGTVATYVHAGGRIGVMVDFAVADTSVATSDEFVEMARDLAMQIAALPPAYLNEAAVPAEVIEHEKNILLAQIANDANLSSKPEQVKVKMVEGKINKYYKENCLVNMPYVKDDKQNVATLLESVGKKLGTTIEISKYVRFEKGEGIEKKEDNFADEVASMMK